MNQSKKPRVISSMIAVNWNKQVGFNQTLLQSRHSFWVYDVHRYMKAFVFEVSDQYGLFLISTKLTNRKNFFFLKKNLEIELRVLDALTKFVNIQSFSGTEKQICNKPPPDKVEVMTQPGFKNRVST